MSHNLTIRENGTAEFFAGNNTPGWHSLGKVVHGLATAKEAIELAQLGWEVQRTPIFVNGAEVKDYKAIVRQDNKNVLSIVGNRYTPIQNVDAFDFFDAVIGEKQAVYETAGSLNGGRKIFVTAKLPDSVYVDASDKHDKWVLLVSSHDGTSGLWLQHVAVRVVCQNTLNIALGKATNQIKIRHTESYKEKKEEAQRILDIANGYFSNLELLLKRLKELPCKEEMAVKYNETLFPAKEDENSGLLEVSSRTETIRNAVMGLFQRGTGNKGETRYDYLNGITEYVDFSRSTRTMKGREDSEEESRFESALLGSGRALKQKAFDLLTKDIKN